MTDRVTLALIAVFGVPLLLIAYITASEWLLGLLRIRRHDAIRPWLWLGPALALLALFLVYPALNTAYISLLNAGSQHFVGLANYRFVFTDATMLLALRNNAIWLVLFTALVVVFGLATAVLTDRVRYGSLAQALILLPMAVSFVAAGVIWRFMYDFRPAGAAQTGAVNAVLTALLPGFTPQAWLINQPGNTVALILAAVWSWTGFAMVVLYAGLKSIPHEVLEAARVDGAGEWRILARVIVPLLRSTILVVATVMIVTALKAFDIVYVMTNGNYGTEVIANRMYKEMFSVQDFGRASSIAVILLLAIIPVMLFNLGRFRSQGSN
ncbi:MAG TPA: sugar ABC transporter permease [Dehalococcoidia bacterium]|nr:sugar ABC transporter permease [Dehalococcoidia bacterium]